MIDILMESSFKVGVDIIKLTEERLDYYFMIVAQSVNYEKAAAYIDMLAIKIGELFAGICNSKHSIEVCNFGSKIFKTCIGGVINFLRSTELSFDASSMEVESIELLEKGIAKAKSNAIWEGISKPTGKGTYDEYYIIKCPSCFKESRINKPLRLGIYKCGNCKLTLVNLSGY
jgi:hypothetical protein